jgi:hypothetical protein
LAGGHRPKRSVASIAHFAQWADTRGRLSNFRLAERPPHPDRENDPTSPRTRGEVKKPQSNLVRASRSALAMTLTDDSAIAAAPTIGDSRMPNTG